MVLPAAVLQNLPSPDETVRAKAVAALCPCRSGWAGFETHLEWVHKLTKDPRPLVRAAALHVFEDAAQMQNEGLPTHPREATDAMRRTRRASRFRPDALDAAASEKRSKRSKRRRSC